MAGEIAKAWVSIIPSMDGSQKTIERELGDSGTRGGKKAGDGFEKGMKSSFSKVGKLASVAGVAAGAALGKGVMDAIEMDGATRKMNASLGLTGPEAEKAGNAAGSLFSSGFGESMQDATAATEAVVSSIGGMRDASEADIAAMARSMGTVATVAEEDVARAAQVAGQMITTGFAQDGVQAADLLTAALQKTPKALRGDLLDAVDEYGPMFQQLGISGEQAMTMLVDASAKGMYGIDKTGDALKEFTIRATDMSKASGEAYTALGMDQEAMTNKLLAGGDTASQAFSQIILGLQDIKDPAAQSQAALALFGTPIEDLGTGEIPKFIEQLANMDGGLGDVAGAAQATGDQINSGPGVALKQFQRTIQTSFMATVEGMIPILTPALDLLKTFSPIIAPLALGLAAFAAGIWLVRGAMAAWQTIQLLMNATLWASPITWIIAAVIALIAVVWLIVANWEQISAWLSSAFAVFGAWWNGFWSAIGAWIKQIWGQFLGFISGVWTSITTWLGSALAAFMGWWSGIWGQISAILKGVWTIIKTVISTAWSIIKTVIATALAVLIAIFTGKWGEIGAIFKSAWNKIGGHIKDATAKIWGVVSGWISNLKSFFVNGWNAIKQTAINVWTAIVNWIKGIPAKVMAGLIALAQLGAKAGEWFGKVKTAAVDKFNDVVAWIRNVPSKILSALGNVGSLLANAGKQILQGFLDGLKQGFENVKNFVGGIGSWIADNKGPKAYDLALLVPAGGWIMDGLGSGIEDSMGGLKQTLGDVSWMIENGIDPEIEGGINARVSAAVPATSGRASSLAPASPSERGENAEGNAPVRPVTLHVENMTVDSEDRAGQVAQELWTRADRAERSKGKVNLGGVAV